jgi:hypothetical protein
MVALTGRVGANLELKMGRGAENVPENRGIHDLV